MFHHKPDLIMKEVNAPANNWCSSGHMAVETFRREGPESEALPTRFFRVSSIKAPKVNGTYCEPCLMIANAIIKMKEDRNYG